MNRVENDDDGDEEFGGSLWTVAVAGWSGRKPGSRGQSGKCATWISNIEKRDRFQGH